jgi:hypothetical protein
MGECSDCRWWTAVPGYESSVRLCPVLTTIKLDIGELLVQDRADAPKEKIFTGQDFGCIQFEPKA